MQNDIDKLETPEQISDLLIQLSGIDIYKQTRKNEYVEHRALLCYILRNKLDMRWHSIARFVKSKGNLNNFQHLMVRDMAYFEAYYNEMLKEKSATVETIEGLKRGRESMRMSLKISPNASTSEAVMKFWATGKMLKKAHKLNKKKNKKKLKAKIDPEIADRAAILANIKKQIAVAKVNAQRAATIEAQKKIGEVN